MEPPKGYTHDAAFEMPTAKEPPREPVMPPMGEDVWSNREGQRAQELRAKALELSLVWCTKFATNTIMPDVTEVADIFLKYIETGEHTV